MVIDLRSELVSRPTPKMVEAMMEAAKSKCSFGLREDPTQKHLEELAAQILGKEDSLFFPTCTMCNQTAIHAFCSPGESIIAESESHIITSEAGALAALSGVMLKPIRGKIGFMDIEEMEKAIHPGDESRSKTSLVVLENTHNRSGGAVLSPAQIGQIFDVAKRHGIPIHLDGARIFNAAVSLNVPVSHLTMYSDSVSVSLNKGLSAPMGAILAGKKPFIQEALRVRQMFGGGWRPTNILAAAGIVALETMIDRLADDHKNARKLAEGITGCKGISIDLQRVQTNLVTVKINHPKYHLYEFIEKLKEQDVWVIPFGFDSLRMALYWEIGEEEVEATVQAFCKIANR